MTERLNETAPSKEDVKEAVKYLEANGVIVKDANGEGQICIQLALPSANRNYKQADYYQPGTVITLTQEKTGKVFDIYMSLADGFIAGTFNAETGEPINLGQQFGLDGTVAVSEAELAEVMSEIQQANLTRMQEYTEQCQSGHGEDTIHEEAAPTLRSA